MSKKPLSYRHLAAELKTARKDIECLQQQQSVQYSEQVKREAELQTTKDHLEISTARESVLFRALRHVLDTLDDQPVCFSPVSYRETKKL